MSRVYKENNCSFCGELKLIAAKGLCRSCYQRQKKTGSCEYKRVKNICSEDDCSNYVVTKGLCDKHRKRLARYGQVKTLRPDDWGKREKHHLYVYWSDTKRRETLNICKEWVGDFWSFVNCVKKRPSKNHYLRAVDINKTLGPRNWQWVMGMTDANRMILTRVKTKKSESKRLRASSSERSELLKKAGNKCQICGSKSSDYVCSITGNKPTKKLAVDHCHKTGRLRGILCLSCNVALGHLKDDISLLKSAIVYLNKNKNP